MESLEIKTDIGVYRNHLRKSIKKYGAKCIVSSILSALFIAYAIKDRPSQPILPRNYEIGRVHISKADVVRDISIAFAVIVSCPLSIRYFRKKKVLEKVYSSLEGISRVIDHDRGTIIEKFSYKNNEHFSRKIEYSRIVDCSIRSSDGKTYDHNKSDYGDLEMIIEKPKSRFGWLGSREKIINIFSIEDPMKYHNDISKLIRE